MKSIVLGIESSCDETAVALIDNHKNVLSHALYSQIEEQSPFGGVVPEVAARAHLQRMSSLISTCMKDATLNFSDISGVAATAGPGLIGGLIVGVMTAKAISLTQNIPFIAVNHLEAHALTVRLTNDVQFPYLLLLVSGGHTQILLVLGVGNYVRLGTSLDDAVGECFDKSAKLMGLGYPGGPAVEKMAQNGDPKGFSLPRAMAGREGCDFSFSGLKTAVRNIIQQNNLNDQGKADLCASLQDVISKILMDRLGNALSMAQEKGVQVTTLVVAGGVAANQYLREKINIFCSEKGLKLNCPPIQLCTDNGVMVAWAGLERLRLGLVDELDFAPRPRWPLDQLKGI